jgi:hypothetical protein
MHAALRYNGHLLCCCKSTNEKVPGNFVSSITRAQVQAL